jgi:hypothetical protein
MPVRRHANDRRSIAQLIHEQTSRIKRGDFSDFIEVTDQEKTAGQLDVGPAEKTRDRQT